MAMKLTPADPGARDSYWTTTQSELRSATRSGDLLVLTGTGALLVTLYFNLDRSGELRFWLILALLLLAILSAATWHVAIRKRRIAAARGLICSQCDYCPHDTEIEEMAEIRQCPRCTADL